MFVLKITSTIRDSVYNVACSSFSVKQLNTTIWMNFTILKLNKIRHRKLEAI